jgi:hypothetical protein
MAHGAWMRLPSGDNTHTRQSPLDDERAIVGHAAGGGLLVEVLQDVLGGQPVEPVVLGEARHGRRPRRVAQLANELADGEAQLHGPPRLVAVPERHLARFARRGRHQHAIVGDVLDTPRRGAEGEGVADLGFEHHLLVELADACRRFRTRQEHAVEAAIGNRAGVGDGHAHRALASDDGVLHAIPRDARPQLGELVRWITARQHVEDAVEHPAPQVGKGRGPSHQPEEVVHVPRVEPGDGDELLRQDVERVARIARGLDLALVHRPRDGGARHEVAAKLGKDHALAGGTHLVAGAPDALQAAGDRGRRLDLHHEIDGAHVDAELERRRGDERPDAAGLEQILHLAARLARQRPVVRAHERLLGQVVERARQALGEPPAVDEEQRRAVRANEFQEARIDRGPDRHAGRALRRVPARHGDGAAQAAHVLHRHFDADLQRLAIRGVDDGDGTVLARRLRVGELAVDVGFDVLVSCVVAGL